MCLYYTEGGINMAFISLILMLLAIVLLVAIAVAYIMLANKVAKEAQNRGESYGFYLFAGIFLSPLLTAIVLQVTADKTRKKVAEELATISQNVYASAELLKEIKAKTEEKADPEA